MIGTIFKEFYEELYYGDDIELSYNGQNYIISSGWYEKGPHFIYAVEVTNTGIVDIYTETTGEPAENIDKFLNAKVFNNQSFLEIEDKVTIESM